MKCIHCDEFPYAELSVSRKPKARAKTTKPIHVILKINPIFNKNIVKVNVYYPVLSIFQISAGIFLGSIFWKLVKTNKLITMDTYKKENDHRSSC